MKHLDLTPDQLLTTTRSVRRRLDLSRPVEDAILRECVEIATQAPSGSNIQPWKMLIITDAHKRQVIADYYREVYFNLYKHAAVPGIQQTFEAAGLAEQIQRINTSADYLAEHLHEVPVLVIPCLIGANNPMTPPRLEGAANYLTAPSWASVLPAVWSFMLAARSRGLGSSLTTLHLLHEQEIAELLGIPYETVTQVALIPVAYTIGTVFRPAPRKALEDVYRVNSW
jgi:nitroreductase